MDSVKPVELGEAVTLIAFNSIEWIRTATIRRRRVKGNATSFNSIEWILDVSLHRLKPCMSSIFQFHWMDSSDVTSTSGLTCLHCWAFNSIEWIPIIPAYIPEPPKSTINFQFHWMDSNVMLLKELGKKGSFNSIEWILHHHGLCTLWKPAHLHYLDSLPLTPRLGVSCILWSPEFICFSAPSPWFFPCVYMGISIATVSPPVYG